MKIRKVLIAWLIISVLSFGLEEGKLPYNILLSWTEDVGNTQTITWKTNQKTEKSLIQFYNNGEEQSFSDKNIIGNGIEEVFNAGNETVYIHTAVIRNLKENTKYIYRVGDGSNWSEKNSFVSGSSKINEFKFLVFGDSQSGNPNIPTYTEWKNTLSNAYTKNTDARFFINMGDLVEIGQDNNHWKNWFAAVKGVAENISFMPISGNHETLGLIDNGTLRPEFWIRQMKTPNNGPDGVKGTCYSYDFGNAHIVVLDSQIEEDKSIALPQQAWLENDLKNSSKTWKIVLFHRPFYFNSASRSNEIVKDAFLKIIDKYHVDIVLNAHDHAITRTFIMKENKIVKAPSEGTVYMTTGRSGAKAYSNLKKRVWNTYFYDPMEMPVYLTVEIKNKLITIKSYLQNGELIDTYSIDKEKDKENPQVLVENDKKAVQLAINGLVVSYEEFLATPEIIDGKWYVPMRAFAKANGGYVKKLDDARIRMFVRDTNITYNLNEKNFTMNKKVVMTENEPLIRDNEVYLNTEAIEKLFDFSCTFDETLNMLTFVIRYK